MNSHQTTSDYSDTRLQRQLDGFEGPGPQNAAPHLMRLQTEELRARAVSRAHLLMNLVPGYNYSRAVASAVTETLAIGLEESLDEKYNREMLEREHMQRCPFRDEECTHRAHVRH